jgi:hypothetical protein
MTEKIQSSSQEKHTALLDEPLSRTDRFFITSMLGDEYPPTVFLSEDTIIGGSTLSSIMELGHCELCNDLKLTNPFHSMHLMYLLDLQKIAWDCFREVQQNKIEPHARDVNLRYALRATDTFIQLYDRLESHWAKQNSIPSGERISAPLTPHTLIDGATLRQIMEWDGVELYLNLKPQNPFESILADLIVRTHKAARECNEQADWKRQNVEVREMNLKYALKGTDTSARLFARLEAYRAKQIQWALHNSATGGEKLEKVASGRFARHSGKHDKARVTLNGNGHQHP